jgi:hypothetical protein
MAHFSTRVAKSGDGPLVCAAGAQFRMVAGDVHTARDSAGTPHYPRAALRRVEFRHHSMVPRPGRSVPVHAPCGIGRPRVVTQRRGLAS